MSDEQSSEFRDDASVGEASKLSRRALLMGLFALPIAALDPEPAQAQYIGFGPFRLHLGPSGGGYYPQRGYRGGGGGGGGGRRHVSHHHNGGGGGGGRRHSSRRSRGGGGGGDNGGGANATSATGLGKADY